MASRGGFPLPGRFAGEEIAQQLRRGGPDTTPEIEEGTARSVRRHERSVRPVDLVMPRAGYAAEADQPARDDQRVVLQSGFAEHEMVPDDEGQESGRLEPFPTPPRPRRGAEDGVLEPLQDGLRACGPVGTDLVAPDRVSKLKRLALGVSVDRRQVHMRCRPRQVPQRFDVGRRSVVDVQRVGDPMVRLAPVEDGDIDVDDDFRRNLLAEGDLDRAKLAGGESRPVVSCPHEREVRGVVDVTVPIAVVPARTNLNPFTCGSAATVDFGVSLRPLLR